MAKASMIEQYIAARRAGTPLLAFTTPDPAAVIAQVQASSQSTTPLLQWDIVNGLAGLNDAGKAAMAAILPPAKTGAPGTGTKILVDVLKLPFPEDTVLFVHNGHRFIRDDGSAMSAATVQAVWNLRDSFEVTGRTLVLLAPHITLPPELADVMVIDDPLPDDAQIHEIVTGLLEAATVKTSESQIHMAVNALRGLSAFMAKQVLAMAIDGDTLAINFEGLKERQRMAIESTPGLTVSRSTITFDDLGGLAEAKAFLRELIHGNEPFQAVAFLDEVDRLFAGGTSGRDGSGTSQDALATFLTQTSQMNAIGLLLVGLGGTGKSALSEAVGNEAGVPTICFDTGSMKGDGLVGQAEKSIRAGFKRLRAISDDRVLLIGTTNNIERLPLEVQRRFSLGVIYVDLPDAEERGAIWPVWIRKYNLRPDQIDREKFSDADFTGDDIRRCCELAYRTNRSLSEASRRVVPLTRSDPSTIAALREQADRRFLSASYQGVFLKDRQAEQQPKQRKIGKAA